jgi:rhodanese-related sulfurtransferase
MKRCLVCLMFAGVLSAPVAAALKPGTEAPEGLAEIPRASGVCRQEAERPDVVQREHFLADLSCAISARDWMRRPGAQSAQLVDLRQADEHREFHALGAAHLTVAQLRTRPYWRDKPVLLIGSGKGDHELYRECARLKQTGYRNVSVLQGGMLAWQGESLPVQGNPPALTQQARLSPAEFWREAGERHNLILISQALEPLHKQLDFAIVLPDLRIESIRRQMERRRKELAGEALAAVVIATDQIPDASLQALQQSLKPVPLLVYAGTAGAVAEHLKTQQAVWRAHAAGPRQPGCGL